MVTPISRRPLDADLLDPGDRRVVYPQKVGVSSQGMVSTQHYLATQAGNDILEQGGNAIDAAIAAAFALGVVEPAASGLGGQTMMVIHQAEQDRTFCLDGGTTAPNRTPPGTLERADQLRGYRATTVPSTPAVLGHALRHYGTKSLEEVLVPAIHNARYGYRISPLQYYLSKRELKYLKQFPSRKFFLKNGERLYPIGSFFKQDVLAQTLETLAREGVEDFYQGSIAKLIHDDMVANDGLIRDDDLAQIPWPVERQPLVTDIFEKTVHTFGPPGAGRTLIQALNMLEQFDKDILDPDMPQGVLLLAYVIRKANLDRSDRPTDPALFAQELELAEDITDLDYAKRVSKRIKQRMFGKGDTTHLSVMDKFGNAVALTQSIERVYGSFTASEKLGFLYNNYMSAFEYQDITHPYYLRPNAVPWASVSPTIIFENKRPWLAIGSPGSQRIVSAILQVLLRLERGATPFGAVEAPRMHCSIKGKVSIEATRMRNDIPELLKSHGFSIDIRDPYSFYLGSVQLVLNQNGEFIGVADPRRDGSAQGPL